MPRRPPGRCSRPVPGASIRTSSGDPRPSAWRTSSEHRAPFRRKTASLGAARTAGAKSRARRAGRTNTARGSRCTRACAGGAATRITCSRCGSPPARRRARSSGCSMWAAARRAPMTWGSGSRSASSARSPCGGTGGASCAATAPRRRRSSTACRSRSSASPSATCPSAPTSCGSTSSRTRATRGIRAPRRGWRGCARSASSWRVSSRRTTTCGSRCGSASPNPSPTRRRAPAGRRTCTSRSDPTSEQRHIIGRMPRSLGVLAAGLALIARPPVRLIAQSPAERAAVEQLRDSLAGVRDSVALRRLEAATIEVAKRSRDDPMIHLRLGFIAYRLGEVAAKAHLDDAAGEFEWAAELRPDWPYPHYGDGLAELALGAHSSMAIENLKQMLGKDYLNKAALAFGRAVQADPSFAQATIDLASTALRQRVQPRLDVALTAVRRAATSPAGRQPGVQLARGRVEREAGDADSAVAAFQAYLAVGGDSGLGLLELARTQYHARRRADGWRSYLAGARAADAGALALYREDLSWIATPAELAAFDGLTDGAARARWLAQFWTRRDVADGRELGERLAEHYRRWFHVMESFRLVSRHRHYDITERYRSTQSELDDRGIVYLRHGEPDKRAGFAADGVEPNETWLYRRPDGDLIFHFVARNDVQDYKLVESLTDALSTGFSGALAAQGRPGLDGLTSGLYASRAEINPVYARLGNALGAGRWALAGERELGQRSIAVGTTTDSYRQEFAVALEPVTSEFVVGAADTAGGQAPPGAFALPAQRLTPVRDTAAGGVVYPLWFRVYVSDLADSLVTRLDTSRVFAAREPVRGGSYLTGQLALPVPAGVYRYRLVVAEAGGASGAVVARDSVAVAPLDGRRFAVSDLVVGRQGARLAWARGPDTGGVGPLAP